MSKQDLIAAIADAAGITKRAAADALQAVINIVVKNLKKGTPVTITGFGTFKLSHRAARFCQPRPTRSSHPSCNSLQHCLLTLNSFSLERHGQPRRRRGAVRRESANS
jgi:nucleoid DNA-binding protein